MLHLGSGSEGKAVVSCVRRGGEGVWMVGKFSIRNRCMWMTVEVSSNVLEGEVMYVLERCGRERKAALVICGERA